MARYVGIGSDEPEQNSERRVAEALKKLSDGWTVIHHVSWQSKRNGRQGDGEADFVLVHPNKGLLVLEVKGGGVTLNNGRWRSVDRHGDTHEIKNPYEQATDSKHALLDWLREIGVVDQVRVGHAVAFPHLNKVPALGPAGTRPITLTSEDLAKPEVAIDRCCAHWELRANLKPSDVAKIVDLLAPTISVRRNLASQSAEAEAGLLELTADQVSIFAGLRAARGGVIVGGAGTGKTVLAIARAQQLARNGFRTLLVCFNELLGREISGKVSDPPHLLASTFHSLCFQEAQRAKLSIPSSRSSGWWETGAPEMLVEACSINDHAYDAIVVDEGQDFSPLWLDSLRCLTRSTLDAPFFLFADPRQDIWGRDWASGAGTHFSWQLTRNLRNTHPIAERVAAAIGAQVASRGVSGPAPLWRDVHDRRHVEREVLTVVERLVDEGFGPDKLVVVCCSVSLVGRLRERTVGPYSFGEWGSRGIAVESVARFKGMEAEAVVLVLADDDQNRTETYIGMSRARSVLVTIGAPQQRISTNWA